MGDPLRGLTAWREYQIIFSHSQWYVTVDLVQDSVIAASQSEACLAIFNCTQRARGREDRLQRRSAGLSIVALLGVVLGCLPSSYGLAGPLGLGKSEISSPKTSLVQKAHGFHCRPMYGWDPRQGIYHVHRHEGICRDYQRCLRVMYRCDAIMGRGWEPWSYERWGFDNWRYDKCMLEAGCY